jgi:hypothetical protein
MANERQEQRVATPYDPDTCGGQGERHDWRLLLDGEDVNYRVSYPTNDAVQLRLCSKCGRIEGRLIAKGGD